MRRAPSIAAAECTLPRAWSDRIPRATSSNIFRAVRRLRLLLVNANARFHRPELTG